MSRPDKIRAVAQQAHDDGDCVCCLPDEMVEFERAKRDTVTITISRADASLLLEQMESDFEIGTTEAALAFEAALEGER